MTAPLHHCELMTDLAHALDATSYLEIGVQEGRTLRAVLAAGTPIDMLILCDNWGYHEGGTGRGSHAHIAELLNSVGYQGQVLWLDGFSAEVLPTLPPDVQVDLALVDADHTYEACWGDMVLAWPHVRSGGAMMVHDYNHIPIRAAVLQFVAEHRLVVEEYDEDKGSVIVSSSPLPVTRASARRKKGRP